MLPLRPTSTMPRADRAIASASVDSMTGGVSYTRYSYLLVRSSTSSPTAAKTLADNYTGLPLT